jgi:hypothetical protein
MNLRIRKHTHHANICDVWLIKPIGGGARTCLMHGTVSEDDAKLLAEKFDATWEDFDLPSSSREPETMPEARVKKQPDLFTGKGE